MVDNATYLEITCVVSWSKTVTTASLRAETHRTNPLATLITASTVRACPSMTSFIKEILFIQYMMLVKL